MRVGTPARAGLVRPQCPLPHVRRRRECVVCARTQHGEDGGRSRERTAEATTSSARGDEDAEPSTSLRTHTSVIDSLPRSWSLTWGHLGAFNHVLIAVVVGFLVGAGLIGLNPLYSENRERRTKRKRTSPPGSGVGDGDAGLQKGGETVEWLNMAIRKVWRVYMSRIERWIQRRLQRAINRAVLKRRINQKLESEGTYTLFSLDRIRLVELKLDYEAPVFRTVENRRDSRNDSDIGAIANLRYTGGMRALFLIDVSISLDGQYEVEMLKDLSSKLYSTALKSAQGTNGINGINGINGASGVEGSDGGNVTALAPLSLSKPWQLTIPVQVYDLDVESDLWLRARLAPLPPYIGRLTLAFVEPPAIGVQLAPYKRAQLMRIPLVQSYLTRLITEDLPNLMVLPRKLEFDIPSSLTAVAEAAIGQDLVRRAILKAVVDKKVPSFEEEEREEEGEREREREREGEREREREIEREREREIERERERRTDRHRRTEIERQRGRETKMQRD